MRALNFSRRAVEGALSEDDRILLRLPIEWKWDRKQTKKYLKIACWWTKKNKNDNKNKISAMKIMNILFILNYAYLDSWAMSEFETFKN